MIREAAPDDRAIRDSSRQIRDMWSRDERLRRRLVAQIKLQHLLQAIDLDAANDERRLAS